MERAKILASLFCLGLFATHLEAQEISGNYKCMGQDPFTKASYNSELQISKNGEIYSFKWGIDGKDFIGTGLLSSQNSNIVAAEYWNPSNPNHSGVVVYQITDTGLTGDWAISDQTVVGSESCQKQESSAPTTDISTTPTTMPKPKFE